jgi:hypothetical protein
MRSGWILFAVVLVPSLLQAQNDGCDVIRLGGPTDTRGSGDAIYIYGRNKYRCSRGVVFVADTAMSAYGMRTLTGNVLFDDPEKSIRTRILQYEERTGQVITVGHTVVIDRKAGSILVAPNGLTYWKEKPPERPEPRIQVLTGRPRLTVIEAAKPGQTADTTRIDADRLEITGQKHLRGWGRVAIKRGKLNANGEETIFNDSLGIMDLWGIARIKSESYDVQGDSIHSEMEGDLFKEVRVFRNARIDDKDMHVRGDRLRIAFDSGTVQRLIALGSKVLREVPLDSALASATTPTFHMRGDSIDAVSPKQKLQRVIAVGHAFSARQPDSLDLKMPEPIRRDWLQGDTVIAHFIEAPDSVKAKRAKSDSAAFDRVLDRLHAYGTSGKPAKALYRMRRPTTDTAEVGYITARRIEAMFRDGSVYDVNASADVRGLYLQPQRREAAAPSAQKKPGANGPTAARNGRRRSP